MRQKKRRADASKGMIVKPEDRADAVSRLLARPPPAALAPGFKSAGGT